MRTRHCNQDNVIVAVLSDRKWLTADGHFGIFISGGTTFRGDGELLLSLSQYIWCFGLKQTIIVKVFNISSASV